ncbi:MAG: ParB N-terminal domain-containing protein [Roseicyclus sp.]|jgi:ParB-like chromosome segregation protein Spo0J|nr:ParB N-terminal domain-containing protein [Roseicyclus sp.]
MAKRKRLTPPAPDRFDGPAPEVKSMMRPAPIAQVAGEASTVSALRELSDLVRSARDEGRLIETLALDAIEAGYLVRDRLLAPMDEDMQALVESLRARGQQTPIDVVDMGGGRYGLISGLRRLTALTRLFSETGDPRFGRIRARIVVPGDAAEAYRAMVEENEIRAGLSLYERARIVAKAVEAGVFPDSRDALLTLYAAASRAKRSKIKSALAVVEALDGALRFPTAHGERLLLDLSRALEGDAGLADRLRGLLEATPADTPEAEQARLTEALRSVAAPVPAPVVPEVASPEAPSSPPAPAAAAPQPTTPTPAPTPASPAAKTPLVKPLDAFEPVPGVWIQSQTAPHTGTRVILSGPAVTDGLRQYITTWLRAQARGEL